MPVLQTVKEFVEEGGLVPDWMFVDKFCFDESGARVGFICALDADILLLFRAR